MKNSNHPFGRQLCSGLLLVAFLVQLLVPLTTWAEEDAIALETETVVEETTTEPADETSQPEEEETEPVVDALNEQISEDTDGDAIEESVDDMDEETDDSDDVEEALPTTGTSTIETGDATAAYSGTSEVNTNHTTTGSSSATTTTEVPPQFGFLDTDTTTIAASNTATTTTGANVGVTTGGNDASAGSATIDTGNAVAYADILNVVNTNLTNADGLVEFMNDVLGYENFDLRDDFTAIFADTDTAVTTPACSLSVCNGGSVNTTITNDNTALIQNNVTVVAETGNNSASGQDASITTGDAYASANIVNVANTSITDSNYLLLVFNNFDDYAGNIVLPDSEFFETLMAGGGSGGGATVVNDNEASVTNTVAVGATTGHNDADGGAATIETGNATALGSVTNVINQNFLDTNSFSLVIRVHGDWTGQVYGLPNGMTWERTADGIRLYTESDRRGGAVGAAVENRNVATIENNVEVYALTGANRAHGAAAADIKTGDAHADATVMNLANTNIIGSNWATLFFTIYGNWTGNLNFGQPDLWLGLRVSSPDSELLPGDAVTYTYTVFNRGDSEATDVIVENDYASRYLTFREASELPAPAGTRRWDFGTIAPGATVERSFTAVVASDMDVDDLTTIPLTALATAVEPDANDDDNADTIAVVAGREGRKDKDSGFRPSFGAKFDIEKTASRDLAQPGDTIDYTVTFHNRGGQLFDAVLVDILEDENGTVIEEQFWPFDTIYNGETIKVEYSITLDSATPHGTYTNTAQVIGFHGSFKPKNRVPYSSILASHALLVGDVPEAQVLGAATCEPYLTEYLKYGEYNNPTEVLKLQQFLRYEVGGGAPLSGYFDLATEAAVRDFQDMHRDEVLTPWGLENTSGFVYYTTQKKINELMCDNAIAFPLSPAQKSEIVAFRQQLMFDALAHQHRQEPPTPTLSAAPSVPTAPRRAEKTNDLPDPTPPAPTPTVQTTTPSTISSPLSTGLRDRIFNWIERLVAPVLSSR